MTEKVLFKRNFKATIQNLSIDKQITVEGLRISFKITKTKKAKGNKATLEIFNLAPINREIILAPATKSGSPQVVVSIFAGYGEESQLVFRGVGTTTTEWSPPDYNSKFFLTDATSLPSAPMDTAYPKNYSVDVIIDDLIKAVGHPRGIIDKIGVALKKSRSFTEQAEDELVALGSTYGFTFDIQNQKTNILLGSNRAARVNTFLGKNSGMVGSPYWQGSIVKVRCLIIPEIEPNSLVTLEVEDTQLKGTYTVAKVVIKGDNFGSDALMDIEMEPRGLESVYNFLPGIEELA